MTLSEPTVFIKINYDRLSRMPIQRSIYSSFLTKYLKLNEYSIFQSETPCRRQQVLSSDITVFLVDGTPLISDPGG